MILEPINEGPPPSKTELLVELVAGLDEQYGAIKTSLEQMLEVLLSMDQRLTALEEHFGP